MKNSIQELTQIAFEHNLTLAFGTNEKHKNDKFISVKTGKYKSDLDIEQLKELFNPVEVNTLSIEDTVQFELIIDRGEQSDE